MSNNIEIKNFMENFNTITERDTLTQILNKLRLIDEQMSDIVKTIYGKHEIWKTVKDYENYSISSFGRIRNNKTDRILKPGKNADGYHQVHLSKNGKEKKHRINRLVAIAFLPNHDDKPKVDHIDREQITNNNITNLRWASSSENGYNQCIHKNNMTGFKGVSLHKSSQKYRAFICINGKSKHLGCFKTAEDASKVYEAKAKEYHGEFYYKNK